jgi:hypothetical protein
MTAQKIANNLDLQGFSLLKQVLENLPSAPTPLGDGHIYYDTTLDQVGVRANGAWVYLGAGAVTSVFGRAGIVAAAASDYDANQVDFTPASGLSSTNVQAAIEEVKTYAAGLIAANDAMTYEGAIDCSANPNYPAADAGHTYKISVAGKIGGGSGVNVQVGDTIICSVDASAAGNHATVGANWVILQNNLEAASSAEANAKSDGAKFLVPSSLVDFARVYTATIGNGSSTDITVTHNLNTKNIIASVRKVSTDEQWLVSVSTPTVNTATFSFGVAPTSNEFEVTISAK